MEENVVLTARGISMTFHGVKALEDGGFRSAAFNAVIEACRRTKELGK